MKNDTRKLIMDLGGYREVATRLGKGPTTVHSHMQSGALPASWYDVLCSLASERGMTNPPKKLFSFLHLTRNEAG
jgi:hypothetical protein